MRPLSSLLFALSATTVIATPQPVRVDFKKSLVATPNFEKRDDSGTVDVTLYNRQFHHRYLANVTIGTPPQDFQLVVDTGSADLWVPYAQSTTCQDTQDGGCPFGAFHPAQSSSYLQFGEYGDFNISYDSANTGETGYYFNDTVNVGGVDLPGFTVGLAVDDSIGQGLMGVGYAALESISYNTGLQTAFPTVLDALVNQGNVNRYAFSLYLNDLVADAGSILFGGIDTAKYTGDLVALPMQVDTSINVIDRYLVTLTSVSFVDSDGTVSVLSDDGMAAAALLDSGTPLMTLPQSIADQLFQGLGSFELDAQDSVVPCSYANSNAKLRFGFGGPDGASIDVPMSELVFKGALSDQSVFDDGTQACTLGIESTAANLGGDLILGDIFLRSAYIVYDLENEVIAIAQAKYTDDSDVSAIPSGSAIPNVSKTGTVTATAAMESGAGPLNGGASSAVPTVATVASPTFKLGSATGQSATGAAAATAGVDNGGDGGGGGGGGGGSSQSGAASGLMISSGQGWWEGRGMLAVTVGLGVISLVGSFVL